MLPVKSQKYAVRFKSGPELDWVMNFSAGANAAPADEQAR